MALETDIELDLIEYLEPEFSSVVIEQTAGNTADSELELLAERNPNGGIFLAFIGSKVFNKLKGARIFRQDLRFKFMIYTKNRRSTGGLYDKLDKLRRKLYSYDYSGKRFDLVHDKVWTEPSKKGFFKAELVTQMTKSFPDGLS